MTEILLRWRKTVKQTINQSIRSTCDKAKTWRSYDSHNTISVVARWSMRWRDIEHCTYCYGFHVSPPFPRMIAVALALHRSTVPTVMVDDLIRIPTRCHKNRKLQNFIMGILFIIRYIQRTVKKNVLKPSNSDWFLFVFWILKYSV